MQLPATPKNHGCLRCNERRIGADGSRGSSPSGQLHSSTGSDRDGAEQHPPDQANRPQTDERAGCAVLGMHDLSFILPTRTDISHDRPFMQRTTSAACRAWRPSRSTPSARSAYGADAIVLVPVAARRQQARATPVDAGSNPGFMLQDPDRRQVAAGPDGPPYPDGYLKMFTARAATSRMLRAETADSESISSFAHRLSGIASVGLNAIEFVNDT